MNELLKKFPWQEAALPVFAIVSVLALLFRLPTPLMDLLLSANLAISATIFLSTFFIRKPLEFSAFPTILLVSTLYRLVLNVSTTRLILTQGNAGEVVNAFSRFVAGDSVVVGLVIFLIFVIIQFVVITKGATRISEVTARFTLDALPGRQASIDFDLNAGNITSEEARRARSELNEQSDFFGAMDGASKFVRGDAIAGLAIVAANLVGGLCIGIFQRHLSVVDSIALYSKLTIGDGLVSQIPAFLISIATGLLVSRTSRAQSVSKVALRQTFGSPMVLATTGVFLVFLAFTGLPLMPLLTLAAGLFLLAWVSSRRVTAVESSEEDASSSDGASQGKKSSSEEEDDEVVRSLKVEPFEITLGLGLGEVAAPEEGPTMLERVKRVRVALASELGFVLPKTRVMNDATLDENQFSIRVNGEETFLGLVYPRMLLAVDTGLASGDAKGISASVPGGYDAYWIESSSASDASADGYELWTPAELIEKRMLESARRDAAALLTRDAAKLLVERLRESCPALVEEALNSTADDSSSSARLARIQQTLRFLLAERVSIRRLDVVLEALNDFELREPAADVWRALDFVRARLSRSITWTYRDEDRVLHVAMFDPASEDALRDKLRFSDHGEPSLELSPTEGTSLAAALRNASSTLSAFGRAPVLLVDRELRYALHAFAVESELELVVVALNEVDVSTRASQEVDVDWRPA